MGWEEGKRSGDEGRRNVIGSDCVCVWFPLVQPREEQGLGVGEESVLVLYNGCDEKRELLPFTDVLFYSTLLVLQSNQTFQVKLDTAVYSLCMCLQHLAQPVSVCAGSSCSV